LKNLFQSDSQLGSVVKEQEEKVRHAAKALRTLHPSKSQILSWSDAYITLFCSTFVHRDTNRVSAQLFVGNFQRRRLIFPTLCAGFELAGGDAVVMESNKFPHYSELRQKSGCIMIALYNSNVGAKEEAKEKESKREEKVRGPQEKNEKKNRK
jgi:hypothetical protein